MNSLCNEGKIVLVLILFCLFNSCKNETITFDGTIEGENYYPIKIGNFWEYQVDSIVYDDEGLSIDTFTTFTKETITEIIENNTGDSIYLLERAVKRSADDIYLTRDLWQISNNGAGVVKTEENLQFVKLVFPIKVGQTWTGNLFEDNIKVFIAGESIEMYKNWAYSIESFDEIYTNPDGSEFENCFVVRQANDENELEIRQSLEVYSEDIGLVFRSMTILDTQCFGCSEPWSEKAEKGFILTQQLINYN